MSRSARTGGWGRFWQNLAGRDGRRGPGGSMQPNRTRCATLPRPLRCEPLEDRRVLSIQPFPLALAPIEPLNSLVADTLASDVLDAADPTDHYTIDLPAGVVVSVVVDPDAALAPTIELLDPSEASLGTAAAGAAGSDALLQTVSTSTAGTYTVAISGADGTLGAYSVRLVVNAALESESHAGPTNDTPATAEDISGSFLSLGVGTAARGAVLGSLPADAVSEDWYHFALADGQSATLALETLAPGAATPAFELYTSSGVLLTLGEAHGPTQQAIENFVDLTTDALPDDYYIRVSGQPGDYHLVVERDATLDLVSEGTAKPQPLDPSNVVLGWVSNPIQQKLTAADRAALDYFGQSVSIDGDWAVVGAPYDDDKGSNSGSAYVFHFNGFQWVEQQKLVAADGAADDRFGYSVAISGTTIIVGSHYDDDKGSYSGSAYVFQHNGAQWVQQQKLVAEDGASGDLFGYCVAIDGTTVVVGSHYDDDKGSYSGSAYVFQHNGAQWLQQQKLVAADGSDRDEFGYSVAIDDTTIVVGARFDDDKGANSGSAYVFQYNGDQWTQQQKLTATDGALGDGFGEAVALDGATVVIASPRSDSNSGSAYIFQYDGTQWTQQQKLVAADGATNDYFGCSVAIGANTIVLGAHSDDDEANASGSAYVYSHEGAQWVQQRKLTADDGAANDYYGHSVAIGDGVILVGARGQDGYRGAAYAVSMSPYLFQFAVNAGDTLEVSVQMPSGIWDVRGESTLCRVQLIDPNGAVVAGAAVTEPNIQHEALFSGLYQVAVTPMGLGGPYVVRAIGATGTDPFGFVETSIANGARLPAIPSEFTITLDDAVRLDTLQASDLTVDGVPATDVTVIDQRTLRFTLQGLAEGPHAIAVAAGAFCDLQGTPVEPFGSSFEIDLTAPRVIASSVVGHENVYNSTLVYAVEFDEPLLTSGLDPSDVALTGLATGSYAPAEFIYDPETFTLTLRFNGLAEDQYVLELLSGDGRFEDLVGHDLDGETNPSTTVPSGDGLAGGDFLLHFQRDDAEAHPWSEPWVEILPVAAMAYQSETAALVRWAGEIDAWSIDREGITCLSVFVEPSESLRPEVTLRDSGGAVLATVQGAVPGQPVMFINVAVAEPGGCTLEVIGLDGTVGAYTVRMFARTALEEERFGGSGNDTLVDAQDISGSFVDLGVGTAARGSVLGGLPADAPGEDWYRFALADGQSATIVLGSLAAGNAAMELHDANGTLLTLAETRDPTQQAIRDFVDLTADGLPDDYFVRLVGQSGDYHLVVTRDATLGLVCQQATTAPQPLDPSNVVLGSQAGEDWVAGLLEKTLSASDRENGDRFGISVAIDGDWAVAGAYLDDTPRPDAPGVVAEMSGSVYVFHFDGGQWVEQQKLVAADRHSFDYFGFSVAIDGATIVVGSHLDDDKGNESGSAYVFQFNGAQWVQQQKLVAEDGDADDYFGVNVAIDGTTIVIGSAHDDDKGYESGSAYVFQYDGAQWVQQQKLVAADGNSSDYFGYSVAVDGATIIVGSYHDDDKGPNSGSAYVFQHNGAQWVQQQKLVAEDGAGGDLYGYCVAIDGTTVVVGAYNDDEKGEGSGSAYVYEYGGAQWVQQQKLVAQDGAKYDSFGYSVAISGVTIVVGANGDDDRASSSGSAYVFKSDGAEWRYARKLLGSSIAGDHFGDAVAIDGHEILVGAAGTSGGGRACINSAPIDVYDVEGIEGDILDISLSSRAHVWNAPVEPVPYLLQLVDAAGEVVAEATGAEPSLQYNVLASGAYQIRVHATTWAGRDRPYLLRAVGATGTAAFAVSETDIADGALLPTAPSQFTVTLNDVVRLGTFDASDLTVDGVPVVAVTAVDLRTLVFTLPPLADGPHTIAVADGAFCDLQGTAVESFSLPFVLDTTGPRVAALSLAEEETPTDSTFVYTIQFDEPLAAAGLDASDVTLTGLVTGDRTPSEFAYDAETSTLTLRYTGLPEDLYTLRLASGDGRFEDLAGHDLDGETDPATTVPSGDGQPGGDFVVQHHTWDHLDVEPWSQPWQPLAPHGSMVLGTQVSETVKWPGETDVWAIELDGPAWLAVAMEPAETLAPQLVVKRPDGTTLATLEAAAPGQKAVLQNLAIPEPGTYTLWATGLDDTAGAYSIRLLANGTIEEEGLAATTNDTPAGAEDLSGSFLDLGAGGAQRGAVVGNLPADAPGEDWYRFTLADGQSATLALATLTTGSASLELYDEAGVLVAVGEPRGTGGEAVAAIQDFVDLSTDGTSDTYYVRVAGQSAGYQLVVARGTAFELPPASGSPTPQDLGPSGIVLGSLYRTPEALASQRLIPTGSGASGFGQDVAVSGNWAVVGAYYATGAVANSGAAFVFQYDGAAWVERQRIFAADGEASDYFGYSVAIQGTTIVVGAYRDHDAGTSSGSAYVFGFNGAEWVQQQKLTAADATAGDAFGYDVAIDGDTIVAGAYMNHDSVQSGSAYVFQHDGTEWVQRQELVPSDGASIDYFGASVALDGDTIVVGAYYDDDKGGNSGSAYVYAFDGTQWIEHQKLTAADGMTAGYFGYSVAIDETTIVVGACLDRTQGAAYVFGLDDGDWTQTQKLTASDGVSNDRFGYSVAVEGPWVVVGAPNSSTFGESAAYLLRRSTGEWSEDQILAGPSSPPTNTLFGWSTAVSGNAILVSSLNYDGVRAYTLPSDTYALAANEGDAIEVTAGLLPVVEPGAAGEGYLTLVDPTGVIVARATGEAPALSHVAALAGTYRVTFWAGAAMDDAAAYVLAVQGATGAAPAFHVAQASIADGAWLTADPGQIALTLDDGVRVDTLDASDLTVDGLPAVAVTVADGRTVVFTLPPLSDGPHAVAVAAGAFGDLQGAPVEPFTLQFSIDATGPRVVASSLLEGATLFDPTLTWTVRFDEPLKTAGLGASDVSLVGAVTGSRAPSQFSYDPATYTLTLGFTDLPEDEYTLRLTSGNGRFEDMLGNDLDGEPHATTTVPSGDGAPGGDFVVHFSRDDAEPHAWTQPWTAVAPLAGLGARSQATGNIRWLSEIDAWRLDLPAGQKVSVTVTGDATLIPILTLRRLDGTVLAIVEATTAGGAATVRNVAIPDGGQFVLAVTGREGSTGDYTVECVLGASIEAEPPTGTSNNTLATAEDISESFVALGTGGNQRGAVLGQMTDVADTADWYCLTLADGQRFSAVLDAADGSGTATLDLYDALGTLLATGAASTNVDRAIDQYVDATTNGVADVYYLRVTAVGEYNLVALRDGTFDLEPNNPPLGPAQRISLGTATLGQSGASSQTLLAGDGAHDDCLGCSVAIDGNWFVTGAEWECEQVGVIRHLYGSVYVFRFDGAAQSAEQKLVASDRGERDRFGHSVATDGSTILVGAYCDNDKGSDSGSAYVFRFAGGRWVQQQKLTASDGAANDFFGYSVDVDGDWAVVGAYGDDNTNGSAYVFHFDGVQWVQWQKLIVTGRYDDFGCSVAIDGATIVVGARQDGDAGGYAGAVYVFQHDGTQWLQQQKLVAADGAADDYFGASVAVDGATIVVGAYQDDDNGSDSGSAYVYRFNGAQWAAQQKLVAADGAANDYFGASVAVNGATIVVGAYGDDGAGADSGSAHAFQYDGAEWTLLRKLTGPDEAASDFFGASVAVSGQVVLIGAYGDDDKGSNSGSALAVELGSSVDAYRLTLAAGSVIDVRVSAPELGPVATPVWQGQVELYNAAGELVASAEGETAQLLYRVAQSGEYTVRLVDDSEGIYLLEVGARRPGDADGDGAVGREDAAILAAHWLTQGGVSWTEGDFNGDGRVDDLDLAILAANWTADDGQALEPTGEPAPVADMRFIGPRRLAAAPVAPRRLAPARIDASATGIVGDGRLLTGGFDWNSPLLASETSGTVPEANASSHAVAPAPAATTRKPLRLQLHDRALAETEDYRPSLDDNFAWAMASRRSTRAKSKRIGPEPITVVLPW
ncbi:MAG: hypothetical protein JW809_04000 [Pirellulales bacterium]|nr:hypothetical protein [Pirellulales bacterium]